MPTKFRTKIITDNTYNIFIMFTGEAINCWVCSTDTDQRCSDPMNMTKSAIEDCSRAPHSAFLQPVCKKQKQRGKYHIEQSIFKY